jgi:hypothetical protein
MTLKISFEKFSKKYRFLKKVGKNSNNTAEEKLVFLYTFSKLLGPKEKREGETFPEI